jgi:hypothetical protein
VWRSYSFVRPRDALVYYRATYSSTPARTVVKKRDHSTPEQREDDIVKVGVCASRRWEVRKRNVCANRRWVVRYLI